MPTVKTISKGTGYTTGGQTVLITGTSLNATTFAEAKVKIDDSDCKVLSNDYYSIECQTTAKVAGASQPLYPGQHGLRRTHWTKNSIDKNSFEANTDEIAWTELLTSAEIAYTYEQHYTFDKITGFFEAPVNG
jgi:hypothetical protein